MHPKHRLFMQKIKHIIVLSIIILSAIGAKAQSNNSYFIHTVSKGQTLYSISRMYQKSIQEIVEHNPGSDVKLSIGQALRIPQAASQPAAAPATKSSKQSNVAQEADDKESRYHTIQPGETLYRLGKLYNISPEDICDANPGLSINNFRAGEVILIPAGKKVAEPIIETTPAPAAPAEPLREATTHKVEKGETVYGISRKYNITIDELYAANPGLDRNKKLKKKTILNIPGKEAPKETVQPTIVAEKSNKEIFTLIEEKKDSIAALAQDNSTRVAVILPYLLGSYAPNEQNRMLEYYQGFLLAVEKLKRYGYSFEINTYDSGRESKSLDSLLTSGALDKMDIIIGALYPTHNKELARFAQEKEIPLVIPFTSKEDEIFRNPMVYIVNTMQSYFFSEVIDHFTQKFPNANVIFVEDSTANNKKEFISALTDGLNQKHVPHTTIQMESITELTGKLVKQECDSAAIAPIKKVLDSERENIFIPLSSSASTLSTIVPSLILLKNDTLSLPAFKLFGYPEWQIYANDMRAQLYEADTYFYASFFSHYSLPEAAKFQDEYARWFDRNLLNIYPRYGMLGYDTGYTFLLAAAKFGKELPNRINQVTFTPVQTGFKFERVNNWGGMVNKKIYFVHYTPEYNIEKIDFDK